jgi:hypothetical protein
MSTEYTSEPEMSRRAETLFDQGLINAKQAWEMSGFPPAGEHVGGVAVVHTAEVIPVETEITTARDVAKTHPHDRTSRGKAQADRYNSPDGIRFKKVQ